MGFTTEHRGRGPKGVVPGTGQFLKGELYIIWCGVKRLGDSGVKVV